MIIATTVIIGLAIFTLQIILHEIKKQIDQMKAEMLPLTKDGAIYPKAKPVQVGELTRTIYIKSAPLYHVIRKA